jgi:hypothetical protein
MEVEVNLNLRIDPDAGFMECHEEATLEVLMDLVKQAFHDIDDVQLTYIELEKR